jgi:anti-anti-sigma factor
MKLTIEQKKGLTILRLQEKRLDAAVAPHLKSKLAMLIEVEGEKYLVVDLSQVQAIDSSGIGALLLAHRNTLAHDGFAAIIGVRGPVYDLLKMTQLDKQLYIFNSVQDVLNNLETVETDDSADEDEPKKTSSASKLNHAIDADEAEDFLEQIPELDDENIDELNLELDDIEELEFPAEDEPKQKKKKTKRTTTKAKATTKSRKNTEGKTKKTASAKSTAAKTKSKKKSKA